jgi:LytS/YehU family sensor histidine kinase
VFARVLILGGLIGPLVAFFLGWVLDASNDSFRREPIRWLMYAFTIGMIFGGSFYLTCAVPLARLGHAMKGRPGWVAWPVIIGSALVGGSLGCLLAITGVREILGMRVFLPVEMSKLLVINALVAAVIAIIIGTYSQKELKAKRASEAAARAQSYALQSQINPHFFFNTLNTISALISSDPAGAQRMIGRLAEMFRYTLACAQGDLVPLEREVEFVRNYLELEKERYRQRLTFRLPPEKDTDGVMLPGLTLQPLVENAIRHGVAKRIDGGEVNVSVERENGSAIVSVLNQTEGPVEIAERPGHALANVRDRLRLAFGERSSVGWSRRNGEWVAVELRVPLG